MASASGTDSYRPVYEADLGPPAASVDVQKAMYEFHGNQGQGRGRPPRSGKFMFRHSQRPRISDRPLLTEMRASSPDPIFRGGDATEKFRQVDDFTDSEGEEMDFSQSDDDEGQPPSKRMRSGPLWSNPDPYTALPPVPETPKKKQDVVKLIRRSRVIPPVSQSAKATAANGEDFISLDFGDSTIEKSTEGRNEPPSNAPTGPKPQLSEGLSQLGKRKREALDDVSKLPPRANKGARLHERGKILLEWTASDFESSTPWYRPLSTQDVLAGVA
jgi:non-canonical poly(A) RNA polymerase PAPD5/7